MPAIHDGYYTNAIPKVYANYDPGSGMHKFYLAPIMLEISFTKIVVKCLFHQYTM